MTTESRLQIAPRIAAWALLMLTPLVGCYHAPRWAMQQSVTPERVAQALDDPGAVPRDMKPEDVPQLPVRTHLRPCCAFGTQLQASLGPIPVPFFSLGNIIDLDHIGPHTYDSGALALKGSSEKNAFSQENNGLVYTCRGGFIDTAHVRDYADWTVFWAAAVARASVTGAMIELPLEGGRRSVVIRPLPPQLIELYSLRRIAVSLAQWIAFQLSVWHEIATAYGVASIDLYPEYVSAFSPEDLYSNLLGTKIGGGLTMLAGSVATDSVYEQNMDIWLRMALQYLQPVSVEAGESAANLVDGVWWDSKARLPNPRLVLRRNIDAGDEIEPWLVSRAYRSPKMSAWVDRECGGSERPLVLHRQEAIHGIKFSDLATLQIDVVVPDPFPFPRTGSKQVTQEDFPGIINAVRNLAIKRFGPEATQPERLKQ
jgi:hypothetical protein